MHHEPVSAFLFCACDLIQDNLPTLELLASPKALGNVLLENNIVVKCWCECKPNGLETNNNSWAVTTTIEFPKHNQRHTSAYLLQMSEEQLKQCHWVTWSITGIHNVPTAPTYENKRARNMSTRQSPDMPHQPANKSEHATCQHVKACTVPI